MPPIPQFAKVLAKRAKAKPKVIAIKPTQTKPLLRKFAKDDIELTKIRKEAIRKSLEKNLPKQSKDDLEILKISNKINMIDFKKLKPSDVSKHIKFVSDALCTMKSVYNKDGNILAHINNMMKFTDMLKKPNDITMDQLIALGKEVNEMHSQLSNASRKED